VTVKAKTKSTVLVLKFTVLKKETKTKKQKKRKKKRNKEEKKKDLATTCEINKTDQIDRSHCHQPY